MYICIYSDSHCIDISTYVWVCVFVCVYFCLSVCCNDFSWDANLPIIEKIEKNNYKKAEKKKMPAMICDVWLIKHVQTLTPNVFIIDLNNSQNTTFK